MLDGSSVPFRYYALQLRLLSLPTYLSVKSAMFDDFLLPSDDILIEHSVNW